MACAGITASEYQIEVSGTAGLKFSGSYLVVSGDGSSTGHSVDGTVPASYTVKGSIASVVFQKQSEAGSFTVQISKGGKVIKESTTSAAYGVVTVATN